MIRLRLFGRCRIYHDPVSPVMRAPALLKEYEEYLKEKLGPKAYEEYLKRPQPGPPQTPVRR